MACAINYHSAPEEDGAIRGLRQAKPKPKNKKREKKEIVPLWTWMLLKINLPRSSNTRPVVAHYLLSHQVCPDLNYELCQGYKLVVVLLLAKFRVLGR